MRFTEHPHPKTKNLDQLSSNDLVKLLLNIELEVFGNAWGKGLGDPEFQKNFTKFQHSVFKVLNHEHGRLIIAGAGTSGRLALQVQSTIASTSLKQKVVANLAGGPEAFFAAKEGVEDSAQAGKNDLAISSSGPGPKVYLGITCGLSAAYVAGGLDYALKQQFEVVAVLGFNPLDSANSRPLPDLPGGLKSLLHSLKAKNNQFFFNPVIGPEPLTGSTRMKGGTATKILLEILLANLPIERSLSKYQQILSGYSDQDSQLAKAVTKAGYSLINSGGIRYLAHGRSGLMALLDASECPPTFGATKTQVQAFTNDLDHFLPPELELDRTSLSRFTPSKGDTLLALSKPEEYPSNFASKGIEILALCFDDKLLNNLRKCEPILQPGILDLLQKRQLNTLSTAAFILAGKVMGNRMIDLRISNIKLLNRALRIVSDIANISISTAKKLLINTLYNSKHTFSNSSEGCTNNLGTDPELFQSSSDEQLVSIAMKTAMVVPLMLVQAITGCDAKSALKKLRENPKVIDAIKNSSINLMESP